MSTQALSHYFKYVSALARQAQKEKRATGEIMNMAPLGFLNAHQDGRSILIPDPATYPLVQEALALRRKGYTLEKICRVMKRRGLRTKRGQVVGIATMDRLLKRDYSSFDGSSPARIST